MLARANASCVLVVHALTASDLRAADRQFLLSIISELKSLNIFIKPIRALLI